MGPNTLSRRPSHAAVEDAYGKANSLLYDPTLSRIFRTTSRLHFDPNFILHPDAKVGLLTELPDQFVLCIGEEHNHPMHHVAQFQLLRALREQTPQDVPLSLGLEMFSHTKVHRAALEDFIFGSDSLQDLKRRTEWDSTWGWPMSHYAKLLNYAKIQKIRIVGLDAPLIASEFVKRKGINGLLGRLGFPDVDLSDGEHRSQFVARYTSGAPPEAEENSPAAIQHAYEAHSLREEFMAASAAAHARDIGGRLVVIAGRDHIAGRRGVPDRTGRRLRSLNWGSPITLLMQGADWDRRRARQIPLLKRLPSPEEADWIWYTEMKKGCIWH